MKVELVPRFVKQVGFKLAELETSSRFQIVKVDSCRGKEEWINFVEIPFHFAKDFCERLSMIGRGV